MHLLIIHFLPSQTFLIPTIPLANLSIGYTFSYLIIIMSQVLKSPEIKQTWCKTKIIIKKHKITENKPKVCDSKKL